MKVAIVGYGIAGIATAILLRKRGHQVTQFEREPAPGGSGAGMLLHPPALILLEKFGVALQAKKLGSPVQSIVAHTVPTDTGFSRAWMDFRYAEFDNRAEGLGIQRASLHRLLSLADPGNKKVLRGCRITDIEPNRGIISDTTGRNYGPYDLVVIADGTHSGLRSALDPRQPNPRLPTTAALVGLIDDRENIAANRLTQYFSETDHLSIWPAGRYEPEATPRCAIAMNVPYEKVRKFRDTGQWRDRVARLCPALESAANTTLQNADLKIYSYLHFAPSRIFDRRAVLVGDAAHSMSPQLGNGAQLAMEDALALAEALDQAPDLTAALSMYARHRASRVRRLMRISRFLTPLLQSDSRVFAALRHHVLSRALKTRVANRLAWDYLCTSPLYKPGPGRIGLPSEKRE